MSRLFVIEAPLKARGLEGTLADAGLPARVQATVGHIYQMPESLSDVGIDSAFREFARRPSNLAVVERLRQEARLAEEVYVATDADLEGDVIAWDVVELIRDIHPSPLRVRLRGMDKDSVLQSVAEASPVRKLDAVGGRTRAIVDRLIGRGFSNGGVAVGRVGTALLGLVASQGPSTLKLRLVAPAEDGGRPWFAETDVRAPLDAELAARLAETRLCALKFAGARPMAPTKPSHMGDVMVRCGDYLDLSPKETGESMQRLYEIGKNSYPRAGSRGVTPAVARKMAEVLKKHGYKVDEREYVPKDATDVHDAPYPIGEVDLRSDPRKLAQDDAVRAVMARDMVKAGQAHREEYPAAISLMPFLENRGFSAAVSEYVARMNWRREVGPRYPGQDVYPKSAVEERRPDVVLLERAIAAGLGRPSTWAKHVEKFMSRGLVDENLNLTDKGLHWISRSPKELLDPRVSAAIESACEKVTDAMMSSPDREPWEINAERIVKALPASIKGVMTGLIAHEPPRPKLDPIEEYGLATSAMDFAESAASPSPTYAPRAAD